MHLSSIHDEDITRENISIIEYESPEGIEMPVTDLNYFGAVCKQTRGLFVQAGAIVFNGSLKNIFQEYEYLKGRFTDRRLIWFRMRFSGPLYVTLFSLSTDKLIIYLCSDDGNPDYGSIEKIFDQPIQMKAFKEVVKLVREFLLPDPPITYEFI